MATEITPAAIEEMAQRLVSQDVRYCVSSLVSELLKRAGEADSIATEDDYYALCTRSPDADDYRDADTLNISVECENGRWNWRDDGDPMPGDFATEVEAWNAAFYATNQDAPNRGDIYEHWLVTEWLADKLEAQGEAIARDVAGLTIWGRCTSGQAIYADGVMQRIARDILEA